MDLVKAECRAFPVGRFGLRRGILLLTNDGKWPTTCPPL
jgi:16S rRNA U516 pseudouridylate synthase RsuA-like enzyme